MTSHTPEPLALDLPPALAPLEALATNLWWTWSLHRPELEGVFKRLDAATWERSHSAVAVLRAASPAALKALAGDHGTVARLAAIAAEQAAYLARTDTWFARHFPDQSDRCIAYLSAEFGLHESLPIYCGGLGVLAGDHLKAASDLGVPLVGIGLLYRHGYFEQRITASGGQQEVYPDHDFGQMPMRRVIDEDGDPLVVDVPVGSRLVRAEVWLVMVGRNRLYLLNSDIDGATERDCAICGQLYGTERPNRLEQEELLGLGAIHLTHRLGLRPHVWHMNEGHSAFQTLGRIRRRMVLEHDSYEEALRVVAARSVFTTHTPVAAGNEAFDVELVKREITSYCQAAGIDVEKFIDLGRQKNPESESGEELSLTVLALRLAARANGVSRLHARVSREMWSHVFPGVEIEDVPIGAVTNGVHSQSWMAPEMAELFARHLGPEWSERLTSREWWDEVRTLPAEEVWRIHGRLKERLVKFIAAREALRCAREGCVPQADFDPNVLTIGFARRFAPYKRANLIFRDLARLKRILCNADRPVQLVFAGKAYPTDTTGKGIVAEIGGHMQDPELARRVVLLENYDIEVGRHLVQGVDVWLNNPRRPLEASGTSGQKVPLNGGINLSVLDGWWPEAYDGQNGWAIGDERERADAEVQDQADADSLYSLLENEVVPEFYERDANGVPTRWLARMIASMGSVVGPFSAARMVADYTTDYYMPTVAAAHDTTRG